MDKLDRRFRIARSLKVRLPEVQQLPFHLPLELQPEVLSIDLDIFKNIFPENNFVITRYIQKFYQKTNRVNSRYSPP